MYTISITRRNPEHAPWMRGYYTKDRITEVIKSKTLSKIEFLTQQTSEQDYKNPTWIIVKKNNKRILDIRYGTKTWVAIDWQTQETHSFNYSSPSRFKTYIKKALKQFKKQYEKI